MNVIVFDLEATCWDKHENISREESEIIEIGAVKVLINSFEIIDTYNSFIRPAEHPFLSEYCRKLTKISQDDVSCARDFDTVIDEFYSWCGHLPIFISWGDYDKNQILRECKKKGYNKEIIDSINVHCNASAIVNKLINIGHRSKLGLRKSLQKLNIEFEGIPHRGIDDAKNVVKIIRQFKHNFIKELTYLNKK